MAEMGTAPSYMLMVGPGRSSSCRPEIGRCPVVLKDTDVEAKDAPGGSIILVKPKKATDLKTLQKEVRERSAKFG